MLNVFSDAKYLGLYALLEAVGVVLLALLSAHKVAGIHVAASAAGLLLFSIFIANCVLVIRRRQWDAWFSVLSVVVIFFGSQLIATVAIGLLAATQHWTGTRASDWVTQTTIGQFSFTLLVEGTILVGIYGYLKLFRIKLSEIGLRRPRLNDPLWGLLAVPAYYILFLLSVGVVSHFVPSLKINQQQDIGFTKVHGSWQLMLTFISLVILPPLTEEIMVRGLLYSSLKKGVRLSLAVVLTSIIFASAHLPEGGAAGPLYIAALDTFILSLVLIYLREKTGSLWASMTLHAVKNGVAFVALFVLHAR